MSQSCLRPYRPHASCKLTADTRIADARATSARRSREASILRIGWLKGGLGSGPLPTFWTQWDTHSTTQMSMHRVPLLCIAAGRVTGLSRTHQSLDPGPCMLGRNKAAPRAGQSESQSFEITLVRNRTVVHALRWHEICQAANTIIDRDGEPCNWSR